MQTNPLLQFSSWLFTSDALTASTQIGVRPQLPTDFERLATASADSRSSVNFTNLFTGQPVREEDSPGNCILRRRNGQIEFVAFDPEGAPVVLGSLGRSCSNSGDGPAGNGMSARLHLAVEAPSRLCKNPVLSGFVRNDWPDPV